MINNGFSKITNLHRDRALCPPYVENIAAFAPGKLRRETLLILNSHSHGADALTSISNRNVSRLSTDRSTTQIGQQD